MKSIAVMANRTFRENLLHFDVNDILSHDNPPINSFICLDQVLNIYYISIGYIFMQGKSMARIYTQHGLQHKRNLSPEDSVRAVDR